jgi:hypothetical protein
MTATPCERLTEYVDGELAPAAADEFALHLGACAACAAALHEALLLVALEAEARGAASGLPAPGEVGAGRPLAAASAPGDRRAPDARRADPAAPTPRSASLEAPIPIDRAPRARRRLAPWIAGAAVAGAAAAAAVLALQPGRDRAAGPGAGSADRVALATAPTRALEGRLAYRGAAAHRPYRVDRAAGATAAARDAISLETLAALERRGDLHGVAAAQLLLGETARAQATLERAGDASAGSGAAADALDRAADRALLQLVAGRAAEALVALDAVLERAPGHGPALWNRALALRDLDLPLMAAEAFTAAAAGGEPGWAAEASVRARELAAAVHARREPFGALVTRDGPRLAAAPTAITPQAARRIPGTTRLFLYDALRGATSAEAALALAPLAAALDALAGGDHLARAVARVAAADFSRRAPLAARYAEVVAGKRLDAAEARALQAALRAGRHDDLLLGALIRTSADGHTVPAEQLPEFQRLAAATGDPWFAMLAAEQAAGALRARGEHVSAEVIARAALTACGREGLDFRCARVELGLAEGYLDSNRLDDARRVARAAWERARRGGEWYVERRALKLLAEVESRGGELGAQTLAVARAYTGELARRYPESCPDRPWAHELVAMMLLGRQDLAAARRELALAAEAAAGCPTARPSVLAMFTRAHVLRDTAATPDDIAALRADIAALRPQVPAAQRALLDHSEGRLLMERDPAAATALLERAIATAGALPTDLEARKARSYTYAVLVLDAGRAGAWDRAWQLLAAEAGSAPAARCAVGMAAEDQRALVVIRDAAGAVAGRYDGAGRGASALARELIAQLATCPSVEVLARAPLHGAPDALPPELAWSYRGGGARPPAGLAAAPGARLVVAQPEPPAELGLPRLVPWTVAGPVAQDLRGAQATPARVLAALPEAGYVEIHAHGLVSAGVADAALLMLSPEADGRYALTAAAIRATPLPRHPIVVLAACHAARTAPFHHEPWSLPAAFIAAGARAVIAANGVIDDAEAGPFFDALREALARGAAPAVALRDVRTRWLAEHPGAVWVRSLMVFE